MAEKQDKQQKAAKPAGGDAKPAKGKGGDRGSKTTAPAPELAQGRPRTGGIKARLREHYSQRVVPALKQEFGYKNPMAIPKVEKVSFNIGLGEATGNSKLMDGAVN